MTTGSGRAKIQRATSSLGQQSHSDNLGDEGKGFVFNLEILLYGKLRNR